jgi:PAS domain-containing protein
VSVVCAWCQRLLSEDMDGPVTHGICPNCAADLEFLPQSFDRFLNTLSGPVLAVDGDGRVLGANTAAAAMVRCEAALMKGRLSGEVLTCVYSELPGGCGRTTHCNGCAIRRAFEHTAATGEPVRKAPAFAHLRGVDGPVRIPFLVSTERLGPLVLVQLEGDEPDGAWRRPASGPRH